jgi:flagellar biosynthesis protein FlhF
MTMKRYQARDMRTALRQIREEQGPNAVIVSTQAIDGGVEVCAAGDSDTSISRDWKRSRTIQVPASEPAPVVPPVLPVAVPAVQQVVAQLVPAPSAEQHAAMGDELRSLRRLLEQQLAALADNDFTRREPQRARLLGELVQLGLSRDLARSLLQELPPEAACEPGATLHHELLARKLRVATLPTQHGGMVVLIGPPGAGKSTTLAKLAVREVLMHGADSLALITTDTARLGSAEQLRSLGRLLGVATHAVVDAEELLLVTAALSRKRLVLIDTAGVPARSSEALAELRTLLTAAPGANSLLVLPASAQDAVLTDCLGALRTLLPHSAVLTRLDEVRSLGGALGALISAQLPLAAICDGTRIPEDLKPARATELVARAVALVHQAGDIVDRDARHVA